MRVTLFGIYIQPELLLTTRTNEYTVTDITNSNAPLSTVVKQNFNKLDIPVLIGLKLGPIRLNAGPSGSILINSPKELISESGFQKFVQQDDYRLPGWPRI